MPRLSMWMIWVLLIMGFQNGQKSKKFLPEKAVTIKSHIDKTGMARIITSENLPVWIDAEASKLDDLQFTQIRETLMKPDEVYWSDSGKIPQSVFIRFYQDGAFKVATESVKVTDFELIADADTVRKGLLVNIPKNKRIMNGLQYALDLIDRSFSSGISRLHEMKRGAWIMP